jgi:hypothetical protein
MQFVSKVPLFHITNRQSGLAHSRVLGCVSTGRVKAYKNFQVQAATREREDEIGELNPMARAGEVGVPEWTEPDEPEEEERWDDDRDGESDERYDADDEECGPSEESAEDEYQEEDDPDDEYARFVRDDANSDLDDLISEDDNPFDGPGSQDY